MLDSAANGREAISADLLDLVNRCRDGEADAWRALLPYFQAIGHQALRPFRLSPIDHDDILSDALASLYGGRMSQFRGQTVPEFFAFLKAVVRNRGLDFVKKRRRWSPSDDDIVPDAGADMMRSVGADVSRDVADDECLEFLRHAVSQLKREERELYLMKARGLKEREIVELTGRPPGTVSSQVARLLERLRVVLRDRGCL